MKQTTIDLDSINRTARRVADQIAAGSTAPELPALARRISDALKAGVPPEELPGHTESLKEAKTQLKAGNFWTHLDLIRYALGDNTDEYGD